MLRHGCRAGRDQVDSVKVVTDDSGMVQSRMEYLPFGETWFQEDMPGFEGVNAPKYNSQELDKETGYYFYNARHYDPEIGRFVTPDTVIDGEYDTQGWNRFSYVHNNPIRYKDPTGHNMYDAMNSPETKEQRAESSSGYLAGLGSGLVSAVTSPLNMIKDAAVWGYNKVTGSNAKVGDIPTIKAPIKASATYKAAFKNGRDTIKFIETGSTIAAAGAVAPQAAKVGVNIIKNPRVKELALKFATSKGGEAALKYGQAFETTFTPGIPNASKLVGSTMQETIKKIGAGIMGKIAGDKVTE